ncbi:MAG: hypothetical protein H7249_11950 [Chitinophagaceae bacterium]|nr:hypothetical protein [Oligoflexus sp.]
MKPIIAIFAFLSCVSCHSVQTLGKGIDTWSFAATGGTIFDSPFQVTTKQLHFDTGELFGKDVILEGNVEYFGAAFTHLLLADKEGRVLVVTTELPETYKEFAPEQKPKVRILGRLERGKKGLPYLMARAVDTVHASAK